MVAGGLMRLRGALLAWMLVPGAPLLARDAPVIVDSSPTYPEHGFERALDDDLSDYVAGYPGQDDFVLLRYPEPRRWGAVKLDWYSANDRARRIELSAPGQDWSRTLEIAPGESSLQVLEGSPEASEWRIGFSGFDGQPRLLLRRLRLVDADDLATLETLRADVPWMTAQDPRNPLRQFRLPITTGVRELSDRLVAGARTQHDQVHRLMLHMRDFATGFASGANPESTLSERVGACGTFTVALLALAAPQGIQGRVINMMNHPPEQGHTVAELEVDGQWRVYDPTFVAWYADGEDPDAAPLSYDAIRALCRAAPERLVLHSDSDRPGKELYTGCGPYLHGNPAGIIGHDRPMMFPLGLDLETLPRIERAHYGTRHQGATFLGAAEVNQMQTWTITGLRRGERYRFVLTPLALGGEWDAGEAPEFELDAEVDDGAGVSRHQRRFATPPSAWEIGFRAAADTARIVLTHPYRGPQSRYLQVQSYAIERDGGSTATMEDH